MTRNAKTKFNKLMRLYEKRYKLFLKYEPIETKLGRVDVNSKEHEDLIDKIVPIEGMMQEITQEIQDICDDLITWQYSLTFEGIVCRLYHHKTKEHYYATVQSHDRL